MAKDASTVFVKKIAELAAGDKTTKLVTALKAAWAAAGAPKDITTVYLNS